MVLEIAQIFITPGSEEDFLAAYRQGRGLLLEVDGCHSVRMTRGVESPSTFVMIVEWDSVETHVEGFRNTDRWVRWRDLIAPHFDRPPFIEHFDDADV